MNTMFDLGAEVFILPALWGILALSVVGTVIASFKRVPKTVEVDGEEYETKSWQTNKARLAKAGAALVAGGLILSSLVVVPPGHRGAIYTTSGIDLVERDEGYSLMVPVLHNANMVNVREQLYANEEVFAQSADFLEFTMQVGVNYRVNPEKAADIFRDVGQQYASEIIKPAVLDISKVVLGQYDAAEIPGKRGAIRADIYEQLTERLGPVGIDVTFVAVEDVLGPASWRAAIENKEIAEEKAIESERLVVVAENEAQQAIERATGEAEAIKKVAEARDEEQNLLGLSPTEYVWYKAWNGVLPSTLLGSGGEFIVDLPQQSSGE